MEPLSQQLSQLSAQAKKTEDRVAKAKSETKERVQHHLEEARREAEAALDKVGADVERASEGTRTHFAQLKSKVDGDMERMREDAATGKGTFEAWQANNYANDKAADAAAAIAYGIAAIKMAEVATLNAIEARARAEIKAEQVEPIRG
jgi:formate dehydrogenase maturation protein FdhE